MTHQMKHQYDKPQMKVIVITGKSHLLQASLPEQESLPLNLDEEEVTTEQW